MNPLLSSGYARDAAAAGQYVIDGIKGTRKWAKQWPAEYIVWLARWAGHWGNRALDAQAGGR